MKIQIISEVYYQLFSVNYDVHRIYRSFTYPPRNIYKGLYQRVHPICMSFFPAGSTHDVMKNYTNFIVHREGLIIKEYFKSFYGVIKPSSTQ